MQNAISPYALLHASKPRRTDTNASSYDLYSLAVNGKQPDAYTSSISDPSAASVCGDEKRKSAAPPAPARKTHYVSDIHSRHRAAMKHTSLHSCMMTQL